MKTTSHPYRDPDHRVSPLYFDTGLDRVAVDLREIKYMRLRSDGYWYAMINQEDHNFSSEVGARIYNALRAYYE